MNKTCLVCSNTEFTEIYDGTLLRCKSCNFVTANMEVDEEILKQTYTENYFMGEEYENYLTDKEILQTNFEKRLKRIDKKFGLNSIKKAVEIGCAYGFFAETITNKIPNLPYVGYDVVDEAITYGKNELKQNLICGDYLAQKIEDGTTDFFMWDVIEHLPDPDKFIEKIASESQPGSRVYITTGDIEKFVPRFQKAKWRMIHPPSHLHYFSKRTLSKLVENYGFKVVDVTYPPVYRSLKLIYYSLFMLRKKPSKFIKFFFNLIPEKWNIPLNTYDIVFLIAEKK